MIDLYVRDREDGTVHRVGDDHHDHLYVDLNGIVQYENLHNGDGTMCGTFHEEKAGYEFVDEDDLTEKQLKQIEEHRQREENYRKAQKELFNEHGIIMLS